MFYLLVLYNLYNELEINFKFDILLLNLVDFQCSRFSPLPLHF